MKDLTSVLFALDNIFDRGEAYPAALERAYDRYNLSERDRTAIRHILLSELRHHLLLSARIRDAYPRFASSDEQIRLLSLGLDLLISARGDQERIEERTELVKVTSEALKLGLKDSDIELLKKLSESPLSIPEELNRDPIAQRSLFYNCPQWILQNYLEDYGPERTEELLKAQSERPNLYLSVNTSRAKADDFDDPARFEVVRSINPAYPEGASLRSLSTPRASQIPEVMDGRIYAQDRSWFNFLDALPLSQYGKILHVDARAGVLSSSLALRAFPLKASVTAAFPTGENLARARSLYSRLGIREPATDFQGHVQNADQVLCQPILSSTIMLKTELSFESFDLVVDTPSNSHTGQARRRPDAIATFNPDNLVPTVKLEQISLLEASFFVNHRGYLAYAVPSLLKVEGEGVVSWLLSQRPEFKLVAQKSFVPGKEYAADGLYYAILRRD